MSEFLLVDLRLELNLSLTYPLWRDTIWTCLPLFSQSNSSGAFIGKKSEERVFALMRKS